jgi:hypothetical protein
MRELSRASIARICPPGRRVPGERTVLGLGAERIRVFDPAPANQSTEPEDKR